MYKITRVQGLAHPSPVTHVSYRASFSPPLFPPRPRVSPPAPASRRTRQQLTRLRTRQDTRVQGGGGLLPWERSPHPATPAPTPAPGPKVGRRGPVQKPCTAAPTPCSAIAWICTRCLHACRAKPSHQHQAAVVQNFCIGAAPPPPLHKGLSCKSLAPTALHTRCVQPPTPVQTPLWAQMLLCLARLRSLVAHSPPPPPGRRAVQGPPPVFATPPPPYFYPGASPPFAPPPLAPPHLHPPPHLHTHTHTLLRLTSAGGLGVRAGPQRARALLAPPPGQETLRLCACAAPPKRAPASCCRHVTGEARTWGWGGAAWGLMGAGGGGLRVLWGGVL